MFLIQDEFFSAEGHRRERYSQEVNEAVCLARTNATQPPSNDSEQESKSGDRSEYLPSSGWRMENFLCSMLGQL